MDITLLTFEGCRLDDLKLLAGFDDALIVLAVFVGEFPWREVVVVPPDDFFKRRAEQFAQRAVDEDKITVEILASHAKRD